MGGDTEQELRSVTNRVGYTFQQSVMWVGERILGIDLFSLVVCPTFYRQFVGGDGEQELRPIINRVGYMFQQSVMRVGERILGKNLFSLVVHPTLNKAVCGVRHGAGAQVSHK